MLQTIIALSRASGKARNLAKVQYRVKTDHLCTLQEGLQGGSRKLGLTLDNFIYGWKPVFFLHLQAIPHRTRLELTPFWQNSLAQWPDALDSLV